MKSWNLRRKTATLWCAGLLIGLVFSGCSAEFNDEQCKTKQDCFPGEICSDGVCLPGGELDAGHDITDEDVVPADVGPDAVEEDTTTPPGQVDSVEITDADGGTDFSVEEGATLALNATAFDADGDALADGDATWTSDDEDVATVDEDGVVTGVAKGSANITATIDGVETTVEVTVTEGAANTAPTADAGPTQNGIATVTVQLDGTGSTDVEDDLDQLQFEWTFVQNPNDDAATLVGETTPTPSFVPSDKGQYELKLMVTDSGGLSDSDTVIINVAPTTANQDPIADAGPDQEDVEANTLVTLDASGSSDRENAYDDLAFQWVITDEPDDNTGVLADEDTDAASFTPTEVGEYVITLTVTDTLGASSTDTVTITVVPGSPNTAPNADAAFSHSGPFARAGTPIELDGSGSSDAEDDFAQLTFLWEFVADPNNDDNIVDPSSAVTEFTASGSGTYRLKLTVTDSGGLSDSDTIVINMAPAPAPDADAGPDQTVTINDTVTLNGTASTDYEDDYADLRFYWEITDNPSGNDTLNESATDSPSFAPTHEGEYEITLTVKNTKDETDTDTVTITVVSD